MTHLLLARGRLVLFCLILAVAAGARAELVLPPVLTDNAVLQHGVRLPVWGWTEPDTPVTVEVLGQRHESQAGPDGAWRVELDPLSPRGSEPCELQIRHAEGVMTLRNLLIGDVWLCSGQSNMEWSLDRSWNGEMESAKADRPGMRLLTVLGQGTQEPVRTSDAAWQPCTPETARQFSAVGYYFGLELHERFDLPIGLIDNAWGGSSCEAWVPRDRLREESIYADLLQRWRDIEATYDASAEEEKHRRALADWEEARRAAKAAGAAPPRRPRWQNPLIGRHRPSNIYNGRLKQIMPYAIRGVIWYQGESNASRAYQYRELFPLMIRSWREAWGQGDFPFYWVQLADFKRESQGPGESDWAELREAQTMTLDREPNTGQAVIIDLGEARDIHPRHKRDVALRLARLAMNDVYGVEGLDRSSPRFRDATFGEATTTLTFDDVGQGLRTYDIRKVLGFELAGEDRVFHAANAKIVGQDRIELTCPETPQPVAARYAWADNPRCNVISRAGLPLTPFRTDDWPGMTFNAR